MEYKIMMTAIIIMLSLSIATKLSAEMDMPSELVGVLSLAWLASFITVVISSITYVWI